MRFAAIPTRVAFFSTFHRSPPGGKSLRATSLSSGRQWRCSRIHHALEFLGKCEDLPFPAANVLRLSWGGQVRFGFFPIKYALLLWVLLRIAFLAVVVRVARAGPAFGFWVVRVSSAPQTSHER